MNKKMIKVLSFRNVFLVLSSFIVSVGFIFYESKYAPYTVSAVLVLWLAYHIYYVLMQQRWLKFADEALKMLKSNLSIYVDTAAMPMVLTDSRNVVRWQNPAFTSLLGAVLTGKDIYSILPNIDKPSKDKSIVIGDKKFIKESYGCQYRHVDMVLHRLIDPAEDVLASTLYRKHLPVVSLIQIDNYDELSAGVENISTAEISFSIEKELN